MNHCLSIHLSVHLSYISNTTGVDLHTGHMGATTAGQNKVIYLLLLVGSSHETKFWNTVFDIHFVKFKLPPRSSTWWQWRGKNSYVCVKSNNHNTNLRNPCGTVGHTSFLPPCMWMWPCLMLILIWLTVERSESLYSSSYNVMRTLFLLGIFVTRMITDGNPKTAS